jgi:hypothetical protein
MCEPHRPVQDADQCVASYSGGGRCRPVIRVDGCVSCPLSSGGGRESNPNGERRSRGAGEMATGPGGVRRSGAQLRRGGGRNTVRTRARQD